MISLLQCHERKHIRCHVYHKYVNKTIMDFSWVKAHVLILVFVSRNTCSYSDICEPKHLFLFSFFVWVEAPVLILIVWMFVLSDLLLYAPFILYLVTNMDIAFYIMYASEVWLSIASTKHINLVNFNQEWHAKGAISRACIAYHFGSPSFAPGLSEGSYFCAFV